MITAAATTGFDTYKAVLKLFPPKKKKSETWKEVKVPKTPPNCSPQKVQEKYHDNSYNCSSQKVQGVNLTQVYTEKVKVIELFLLK